MATLKDDRIEARISGELKNSFTKAAQLQGLTLSEFIITCLQRETERVLKEKEIIELSERDRDIFVRSILSEAKPNKILMKAAQKYKNYKNTH